MGDPRCPPAACCLKNTFLYLLQSSGHSPPCNPLLHTLQQEGSQSSCSPGHGHVYVCLRLTEEMLTPQDAERQLLGTTCTVLARRLWGLSEEKERLKRTSMKCVNSAHEHCKHTGVSSPCSYPTLNLVNSTSKERIKSTAKSHF